MPRPSNNRAANGRKFTTQQSLDGYVKGICDIMRRSNCAGALQYVPELTWLLFLRIFDEQETREAEYAEAVGAEFTPAIEPPYRWQDWVAPDGPKRIELGMSTLGAFFGFVNGELIPYLRGLKERPSAGAR
jgi:type I restriction enzyme M protein